MKTYYKSFPSNKMVKLGKDPLKVFIGGIVIGTFMGIVIQAFVISLILL